MTLLTMTLLIMTLLIMTILKKIKAGYITYNDITYNWFYLKKTLLITVNKNICVMSHLLMLYVKSL
jgi:hypothetical protein